MEGVIVTAISYLFRRCPVETFGIGLKASLACEEGSLKIKGVPQEVCLKGS